MIKAECDRCGKQQETERAAVKVAAGLLSRIEIPVPEGWRRVDFPVVDRPETERKELCPGCVNALRLFLEGDGKVPGLLEPETLEAVEAAAQCVRCTHHPKAHTGANGCQAERGTCTCELSEFESTDEGWAETPDERPNLTARAEALSSAEAMEAIRTGERAGQLLTCPEKAAQAAECSGWYERGRLTAHMQDAHGGGQQGV